MKELDFLNKLINEEKIELEEDNIGIEDLLK